MNLFALTVIALQIAASASYIWQGRALDAAIWGMYAAINIALILKG